jgi:predicted metal-dependent hydrolase
VIAGSEERELTLGTERIAYRLHRSSRRTLEISVGRGGVVEVRAPDGPPIERIESRLRARSAWIRRKLAATPAAESDPPRRFVSGESHRYLGRQYRLKVTAGARPRVRVHGGRLHVEVRDPGDAGQVRRALVAWFRQRARTVILQRVAQLTSLAQFGDLQPTGVSVRALMTRWGSCSASGRLLLNSQLIELPSSAIDYVIAHELCHLRVAKHGARFDRLLARLMPDWRDRQETLSRAMGT